MTPVLQSSPHAGYLAHQTEIDAAVARTLSSGWYILGAEVAAFETEFAAYLGTKHVVGVANGTDGLRLVMRACGIGPGDLVFTVAHTAVATVAAIDMAGAAPVYVDIDPRTFTMDPARLEDAIKNAPPGTPKAVLPVHLYGHPADLTAITEICRRSGLRLLEDCSQAHGAAWNGQKAGTWGDAAVFSCYPTKNLGALGDAGVVVTSDSEIDAALRLLREYGWRERYVSAVPGENSRLDEMQAAILRVKLRYLDDGNARRRAAAARYDLLLQGIPLTLPSVRSEAEPVYHQYVIRSERRDALREHLKAHGIGTLIHYPVPIHQQPAYAHFARGPLPETEAAAREVLSLPLYPEIPDSDLCCTAEAFFAFSS
jgi:dTDP-4-amino-4,6-dideoxygalactose transaminase